MAALVFNCQFNGLSIIQELGRRGVHVLALDSIRSIGTYSRYARYLRCPDPQVAEEAFVKYLLQLGPLFPEKPVLFPTNDHWAIAISRHKERLSQYYLPCVADLSVIELIIQKQSFNEWALENGLPVPRSWRSDDISEVPSGAYPIVAKPEYRRISSNDQTTGQRATALDQLRLTILRNQADLTQFMSQHAELMPHFIFQEYVVGLSDCMYTIGVYADRTHEVKGIFTGRKVRGFPPDMGDCIVGQVETVPDELKTLVKNICRSIGYHGIAEFEFKRDAVTGQFKLIEINPRSWSWVGITPACDVSLPWIAYADLKGIKSILYKGCNMPSGSVKYAKVIQDMQNCLYYNYRSGFPSWDMTIIQWWKSLKSDRLVCAEFAKDDLRICIREVVSHTKSILKALLMHLIRRGGKN